MRTVTKQSSNFSHLALLLSISLFSAVLSGCAGPSVEERNAALDEEIRAREEYFQQSFAGENARDMKAADEFIELGNYRKAISSFSQIISLYERDYVSTGHVCSAYLKRGYCYFQLANDNFAIDDFGKAINSCYGSARAHARLSRAMTYARKKQYEKAIADIDEGLKIDPTDSKFLDARSRIQTLALRSGLYDD